jgi:hypothetical protein
LLHCAAAIVPQQCSLYGCFSCLFYTPAEPVQGMQRRSNAAWSREGVSDMCRTGLQGSANAGRGCMSVRVPPSLPVNMLATPVAAAAAAGCWSLPVLLCEGVLSRVEKL